MLNDSLRSFVKVRLYNEDLSHFVIYETVLVNQILANEGPTKTSEENWANEASCYPPLVKKENCIYQSWYLSLEVLPVLLVCFEIECLSQHFFSNVETQSVHFFFSLKCPAQGHNSAT